jgi:hypothetical protein
MGFDDDFHAAGFQDKHFSIPLDKTSITNHRDQVITEASLARRAKVGRRHADGPDKDGITGRSIGGITYGLRSARQRQGGPAAPAARHQLQAIESGRHIEIFGQYVKDACRQKTSTDDHAQAV